MTITGEGNKAEGGANIAIGMAAGELPGSSISFAGPYIVDIPAQATFNIAIGTGALSQLSSGSYNLAIGRGAGEKLTNESHHLCIGDLVIYSESPEWKAFMEKLCRETSEDMNQAFYGYPLPDCGTGETK